MKELVAGEKETFSDDVVHEKDILLTPLKKLLMKVPRHKEPYKQWKKDKDGSVHLLPRQKGTWHIEESP